VTVVAGRARLAVTAVWALFFYALWLTGTADRYLGARTQWLVPFGAVTLTVAAVLSWRASRPRASLRLAEAVGLLALFVPLALVALVPHAELGAYAANHKSGSFFPAVKPRPPATPRDVTLLDVRVAEDDDVFALASHIHRGTRVGLLGLVTARRPAGFTLTRFYITCCVADAQPLTIDVNSARPVTRNEWVWVTGILDRRSKHYSLTADRVAPRRPPASPYLSFTSD
jgi:uncharacterized repeat protein (TIGR03943 family)